MLYEALCNYIAAAAVKGIAKRMGKYVMIAVIAIGVFAVSGVLIACMCYSQTTEEEIELAIKETKPDKLSGEQSGRLKVVADWCKKLNWFLKTQSWENSIPHLIVDDERKVMFCAIPKVASSNWKRTFIKALNITRNGSSDIRDVHAPGLLPDLRLYSKSEQEYRLRNYFKFMFVRHPMERLLSAYRNKIENKSVAICKKDFGRHALMKVVNAKSPAELRRQSKKISFFEFTNTLTDPAYTLAHYNVHWKQYYKLCHPCFVKYDFVGKIESFEADLEYIRLKTGVDYRPSFQHHRRTTTPDVSREYFRALSNRTSRVLSQMYSLDMSLFQYDWRPKSL